jgi:hypothetical protein
MEVVLTLTILSQTKVAIFEMQIALVAIYHQRREMEAALFRFRSAEEFQQSKVVPRLYFQSDPYLGAITQLLSLHVIQEGQPTEFYVAI